MTYSVNAMGKQCPVPVVMTKQVLDKAAPGDELTVLVDNETAVKNLGKLAKSTGCTFVSQKTGEARYEIKMVVRKKEEQEEAGEKNNLVAAISSDKMGEGDDSLGAILMKGFLFALTQLNPLPRTVLFYNGGAKLTVEGSPCLEDIKTLADQGVSILTCGTCLNHYALTESLAVGEVTNMYTIVETLAKADKVIRP